MGSIQSSGGLKQGDPLSPYLFTTVMEYFTILFDIEMLKGNINPISKIQPTITHLIYVDDLMLFVKLDYSNAYATKGVFECLNRYAGLQINEFKHQGQRSNTSNIEHIRRNLINQISRATTISK